MTQQKDRADFVAIVARESTNPNAAMIALDLLDRASTAQRYAVAACNRGLSERETTNDQRNDDAMRALVAQLGEGFALLLSGDPRGCVVKLRVPSGYTDDFVGTGVCVPTRRY